MLSSCPSVSSVHVIGGLRQAFRAVERSRWEGPKRTRVGIAFPARDLDKPISGLKGTRFIFPYPPAKFSSYGPRAPEVVKITYEDHGARRGGASDHNHTDGVSHNLQRQLLDR